MACCFMECKVLFPLKKNKLEMCQYDTDAPAQGPFSPAHRYFAKNEIKKGHKTHNNWPVLP